MLTADPGSDPGDGEELGDDNASDWRNTNACTTNEVQHAEKSGLYWWLEASGQCR